MLAAAVDLIDEGGLDRLSMREVARAAGVSHQAPYHYFADREAILAAIAEAGFGILGTRLERSREGAETAAARLTALGRAYVEFALDHPALFRVMFRGDVVDVERFPECKRMADGAFARLPVLVQEMTDEGLPAAPSAQALIVLFWSTAHGLACLLLDGPLAKKVPEAATARDALVEETMVALQHMVEARLAVALGGGGAPRRRPKLGRKPSRAR
ncbi:MAG: TetR/AcrR family transcriptional regulator [Deltaproteobacteria bacterium]|nr:TetR/AcrR family transcriptional regulator [Deltaproteobacteria bacterium]